MEWNDGPSLLAGFVEHKKAPPLRKSGPESITETAFDKIVGPVRKANLKRKKRATAADSHTEIPCGRLLRGRP